MTLFDPIQGAARRKQVDSDLKRRANSTGGVFCKKNQL